MMCFFCMQNEKEENVLNSELQLFGDWEVPPDPWTAAKVGPDNEHFGWVVKQSRILPCAQCRASRKRKLEENECSLRMITSDDINGYGVTFSTQKIRFMYGKFWRYWTHQSQENWCGFILQIYIWFILLFRHCFYLGQPELFTH